MSETVILQHVALAPHTTLHIGGVARYFVTVDSLEEVQAAASFARQKKLPLFVLAGGSNVLFSDEGFAGVVMKMNIRGITFTNIAPDRVSVEVGAGENFDEFIDETVSRGLWGLENLSSIPGMVGATPVQNVGAYGVEVGELIASVRVVDKETGQVSELTKTECCFGYRDSLFKHLEGKSYIVTHVTFALSLRPMPRLAYRDLANRFSNRIPSLFEIRDAVAKIRADKFPDWNVIGTAGSFFKNPTVPRSVAETLTQIYPDLPVFETVESSTVKLSLGYILDKICNLKGVTRGKVGLYKAQALVLVAERGATAREVTDFAIWVTELVREKTRIDIEWEVNFIS